MSGGSSFSAHLWSALSAGLLVGMPALALDSIIIWNIICNYMFLFKVR